MVSLSAKPTSKPGQKRVNPFSSHESVEYLDALKLYSSSRPSRCHPPALVPGASADAPAKPGSGREATRLSARPDCRWLEWLSSAPRGAAAARSAALCGTARGHRGACCTLCAATGARPHSRPFTKRHTGGWVYKLIKAGCVECISTSPCALRGKGDGLLSSSPTNACICRRAAATNSGGSTPESTRYPCSWKAIRCSRDTEPSTESGAAGKKYCCPLVVAGRGTGGGVATGERMNDVARLSPLVQPTTPPASTRINNPGWHAASSNTRSARCVVCTRSSVDGSSVELAPQSLPL